MTSIAEPNVLGDIVKFESPMNIAREEFEVTRVLAATVGLQVGQPMDFDAAVAAVQTYTSVGTADGGTFRIGYKGLWTAALAWNATVANINTALDTLVALSGGTAGDIVFANVAGDLLISTNTFTWLNTLGNPPDVIIDLRLCTDGGVNMHTLQAGAIPIATTTAGELATMKMVIATTANTDCILLEPVSLIELQDSSGEALRRPFLVRGHSIINATRVHALAAAGTVAALITALAALGIDGREESAFTEEGLPRI